MLEDTITAQNWERDPEAMATRGILRYLASPRGFTAVELLHLLMWIDANEYTVLTADRFVELLRAEQRREQEDEVRDAA